MRIVLLCACCSRFFSASSFAADRPGAFALAGNDTLPSKTADAAGAAQKAAVQKASLFKKLGDLLRFKKNAQKRQKELITRTIADLNFPDSIKAASVQLQVLIDTVAVAEKEHYRQLKSQLDALIVTLRERDSLASLRYPILPAAEPVAEPVVTNEPFGEEAANTPPVISARRGSGSETGAGEKYQTLALIKKIANGQAPFFDSANAGARNGNVRTYQLQKKIDICGYYNAGSNLDYTHVDFRFISTLIYDSLFTVTRQGHLRKLKKWKNDGLIEAAKKAGCRILYSLLFTDKSTTGAFLSDIKAIENFTEEILVLQKEDKADGININFGNFESYNKDFFTEFIRYFSQWHRKLSSPVLLFITLPVYDEQRAYDVNSLSPFADRFCIDFSSNLSSQAASLAPLQGKQRTSMASSVSYYLNQKVTPEKFMLNLGYKGAKWLVYPDGRRPDAFVQTLPYSAIRNKTYAMVMYDSVSSSAYIDTLYEKNKAVVRIWFDDENSLAAKYDFILQNGLGGMGFGYLGYDGTYGELWDELLYKFIRIDSVDHAETPVRPLSFSQKLFRRFRLYDYILHNPCAVCFDNMDPNDSLHRYIKELKIDSLVSVYNKAEGKNVNTFGYLTKELNAVFLFITLFFLLLLLVFTFLYVHYTKALGDKWKYKKRTGWTVTVLSVLFFWSLFDYLFTNDLIPFFGVSDDLLSNGGGGKIDCAVRDPNCINMPLNTLLGIIVVASSAAFFLTRYLLIPLFKREDVP